MKLDALKEKQRLEAELLQRQEVTAAQMKKEMEERLSRMMAERLQV